MTQQTPQQIRERLLKRKFCPALSLDAELKEMVCFEDGKKCRYPNTRINCTYFKENILSQSIRNAAEYR